MAGELQWPHFNNTDTLYALRRNAAGQVWDTVSAAYVTYTSANLARYVVTLARQGTSKYYAGNDPDPAASPGNYVVCVQAGGSPAESDVTVGAGSLGPVALPANAYVTLAGPAQPSPGSSPLPITAGDDYLAANGRQLSVTESGTSWPDSPAGAKVEFRERKNGPALVTVTDVTIDPAVGHPKSALFDLPRAQSGQLLPPGCTGPIPRTIYVAVVYLDAQDDEQTVGVGTVHVSPRTP